jgi:hypothetical protein
MCQITTQTSGNDHNERVLNLLGIWREWIPFQVRHGGEAKTSIGLLEPRHFCGAAFMFQTMLSISAFIQIETSRPGSLTSASGQQKRFWNLSSHNVDGKNAALVTREQIIDKIADD